MEPRTADRPAEPPPMPPVLAEPATGRALWPTFMRRTLSDEALREPPRKPDA
jgi:hypothetical protein